MLLLLLCLLLLLLPPAALLLLAGGRRRLAASACAQLSQGARCQVGVNICQPLLHLLQLAAALLCRSVCRRLRIRRCRLGGRLFPQQFDPLLQGCLLGRQLCSRRVVGAASPNAAKKVVSLGQRGGDLEGGAAADDAAAAQPLAIQRDDVSQAALELLQQAKARAKDARTVELLALQLAGQAARDKHAETFPAVLT